MLRSAPGQALFAGLHLIFSTYFDRQDAETNFSPSVSLQWPINWQDANGLLACASLTTLLQSTLSIGKRSSEYLAGQQLRQTIEQPDIFRNEVGFKTLGLFPGTAVQEGRWRSVDGSRYMVRPSPVMSVAASSLYLRLEAIMCTCNG